jgi:L-rhamnose-H+ transport protein
MLGTVWLATLLVVAGAFMQASFALPMKWAGGWAWENIWLVYSVVGLLIIPWFAAWLTIPHLLLIFHLVSGRALILAALFGFGWGIANVLFGLALPLVGLAISYAIIVGMSAALGSLIPLIFSNRSKLLEPSGLLVLAGVALTLVGVLLVAVAGRAREIHRSRELKSGVSARSITVGIILCVLAGLLAPMLNFSFAFGSAISVQATRQGAAPSQAANAIWAICLVGGFVSNGGYSMVRLFKNASWRKFAAHQTGVYYGLSSSMGVLWTVGLLLYGWGAIGLGSIGAAIGWPVFQATMIIVSSGLGIATGEWRDAERSTFFINSLGLGILIAAIVILSFGARR